MDGDNRQVDDILQTGEKPDVEKLIGLFNSSKNDLASQKSYYNNAQDIRYCRWAGMSPDGKKHADQNGRVFPWEGASDLRTFSVDGVINSLAASALTALFKANISAIPRSSVDCEQAGKISQFLDWYFKAAIPSARRETELWLQWALSHGKSVMGVFWDRQEGFGAKDISAVEAAQASAAIAEYIADPAASFPSDSAIADARLSFDLPSQKAASDLLLKLKNFGVAEFRVKKVLVDRVKLRALRLGIDFFCPNNIDDIESAPYIFVREFLTVSDLRVRAASRLWPADFTQKVIDAKSDGDTITDVASVSSDSSKIDFRKIEICTAYYKSHDHSGAMSLRYCVFAPSVSDAFAEAGEYDIAPQRYPFVAFARENVERELFDSRGVSEIAEGWQREIKTQKDSRIDRTSLTVNPPKLYRAGRQPTQYRPGAWIPVSGADFKIIEEVASRNTSIDAEKIELQVAGEMSSYFGCSDKDSDNAELAIKKQAFINSFFAACARLLEQIYFLYRQFGPDQTVFAPLDEPDGNIVSFDRELLGEDFSFKLSFDARDENLELFLKKFDVAAKFIAAFDKTGSVNTSRLLKRLLSMLFPDEIKSLVSNEEDSYRREVLETQSDLAAIYSAQPVNAPERCNAQLRLQIVSQYAQTPSVAARMQADKDFADALANYAKQLQFQIQQSQNAVIGRIGATPADGLASDMEAAQ